MKKQKQVFTCVFVLNENSILLGYKKRGLLSGKWNGFGGKVEVGETILEAASRELQEECGLISEEMLEHGVLTVEFSDPPMIAEVYLFTTTKFTGNVIESNEMMPKWFDLTEIPFDTMCYDIQFWLPLLLEGKKFNAFFSYDKDGQALQQMIEFCTC